uniref:Acyl carrier protein n=1 Tax=Hemiselmis andersenii TaxID=464988 RepID=A0A7S0UHG3_HEMAN
MSSLRLLNSARLLRPAATSAARVAMGSPATRLAAMRPTFAPLALHQRGMASAFLPKEEVQERVISVVKNFQNVDPAKVTPEAHFTNDLGLDSLDTVEVVMAFEDEFAVEIPDAEAEKISTVGNAVEYIASHPQAK